MLVVGQQGPEVPPGGRVPPAAHAPTPTALGAEQRAEGVQPREEQPVANDVETSSSLKTKEESVILVRQHLVYNLIQKVFSF